MSFNNYPIQTSTLTLTLTGLGNYFFGRIMFYPIHNTQLMPELMTFMDSFGTNKQEVLDQLNCDAPTMQTRWGFDLANLKQMLI